MKKLLYILMFMLMLLAFFYMNRKTPEERCQPVLEKYGQAQYEYCVLIEYKGM